MTKNLSILLRMILGISADYFPFKSLIPILRENYDFIMIYGASTSFLPDSLLMPLERKILPYFSIVYSWSAYHNEKWVLLHCHNLTKIALSLVHFRDVFVAHGATLSYHGSKLIFPPQGQVCPCVFCIISEAGKILSCATFPWGFNPHSLTKDYEPRSLGHQTQLLTHIN